MDGPSRSFDTKLILCRIILKTSNQERHRCAVPGPALPAPPKVKFFWSAIMYRLPERLLVTNPIDHPCPVGP
jgi:hypothetical protein